MEVKNVPFLLISITTIIAISEVSYVSSHGRMMEPPARNTMWRFGFPTKANYEDSELFCGGIKTQWEDNKGKCGVCGDSYSGIREHETGGFYARNITTRVYAPGSPVDIVIDIVTNHGGRFWFDMCWRDDISVRETEDCFHPLHFTNSTNGSSIYHIPSLENHSFKRIIQIQLPRDRTCDKCILRWHWEASMLSSAYHRELILSMKENIHRSSEAPFHDTFDTSVDSCSDRYFSRFLF